MMMMRNIITCSILWLLYHCQSSERQQGMYRSLPFGVLLVGYEAAGKKRREIDIRAKNVEESYSEDS